MSNPTPAPLFMVPDSGLDQDLACWRCGYNLRGLVSPRCPECGLTFTWQRLLDPEARPHPYLWEQHRRHRPVRSYVRTLLGVLRPQRFWRGLHLGQFDDGTGAAAFFAVSLGLLVGLIFVAAGVAKVADALLWSSLKSPAGNPRFLGDFWHWLCFPDAPAHRYWPTVAATAGFAVAGALLSWASLVLFRPTLRRARLPSHHVTRVVAYSSGVWVAAAAVCAVGLVVYEFARGFHIRELHLAIGIAVVVLAALTGWAVSLVAGFREYLRLRRGWAMVLASQTIVALILLLVYKTLGERLM